MDKVIKKFREAQFFLGLMRERERLLFGDPEPFDFYLSAFLTAANSIDDRLEFEQRKTYTSFRSEWKEKLSPEDDSLFRFLSDDRNHEVHRRGSRRQQGLERIPAHQLADKSLTITQSFPAMYSSPAPFQQSEIIKRTYSFTIEGAEMPAVTCCEKYLGLLERMLADYCGAQPA